MLKPLGFVLQHTLRTEYETTKAQLAASQEEFSRLSHNIAVTRGMKRQQGLVVFRRSRYNA